VLEFNEALAPTSAQNRNHYWIDQNLGNPFLVNWSPLEPQLVELGFNQSFENKRYYQLQVRGVADRFENRLEDSLLIARVEPEEGDVVFNEIMPDPVPSVGNPPLALPEKEYIELYNASEWTFDLEGWILMLGDKRETLPSFQLEPDSFVVLVNAEAVIEFPSYIPVLGVDMGNTALTNTGQELTLLGPQGQAIDWLEYHPDWYTDPEKAQGGWSLERIDPLSSCIGLQNWRVSESPQGGSPGKVNSVWGQNSDSIAPRMERLALRSAREWMLFLSEAVADSILAKPDHYAFDPPLILDSVQVLSSRDRVILYFKQAPDAVPLYKLWLTQKLIDCSANQSYSDTLLFGIPSAPRPGELLINEILFNPPPEGADYIELYHAGETLLDLLRLRIGRWDPQSNSAYDLELLLHESFLVFPGQYLVLSEDTTWLREHYRIPRHAQLCQVLALPSWPDDEGSYALTTANLQLIDYGRYHDGQHFSALDNLEGVSLERLSFDQSTADQQNWQSAASSVNYGTPGYENSQRTQLQTGLDFSAQPQSFSPNQDGYKDFTIFNLEFGGPSNIYTLQIFSSGGTLVRELAHRQNSGEQSQIKWDGTNQQGQLLPAGIYIGVLEFFNARGESRILRTPCVLAR
jgi:hypothetical protein